MGWSQEEVSKRGQLARMRSCLGSVFPTGFFSYLDASSEWFCNKIWNGKKREIPSGRLAGVLVPVLLSERAHLWMVGHFPIFPKGHLGREPEAISGLEVLSRGILQLCLLPFRASAAQM